MRSKHHLRSSAVYPIRWGAGRGPTAHSAIQEGNSGESLCGMDTKVSFDSADQMGMLFSRGITKYLLSSSFDNSCSPSGGWRGETQKAVCESGSVSHVPPFQSSGMFSIRKKNEKKPETTQLFLFHPNWVVCPFAVAMATAALLLLHLDLFPN